VVSDTRYPELVSFPFPIPGSPENLVSNSSLKFIEYSTSLPTLAITTVEESSTVESNLKENFGKLGKNCATRSTWMLSGT
jgi:hypothetical protein